MTLQTLQWVLASGKAVWGFISSLKCVDVVVLLLGLLCFFVPVVVISIRRFQTKSVSLSLPFKLGSVTFETTPTDRIVAWKAYVQLVTRKAALPFDEERDVIEDVYASLYSLFDTTRDLLLNLPPKNFQNPDGISAILLRVLNDGLRPHLTRWQSDFRTWIENARRRDEFLGMSPVGLQKRYPWYSSLVEDLRITNTELSKLADELYLIARGKSLRTVRPAIRPEPPQKPKN